MDEQATQPLEEAKVEEVTTEEVTAEAEITPATPPEEVHAIEEAEEKASEAAGEDRAAYNCPECAGEGLLNATTLCPACAGTGKVS